MTVTVAVTGAAGAIGSRVVRALSWEGRSVTALVRDPERCPTGPGVRPAMSDYADPDSLDRALDGADALVFIGSDGEADRMLAHHRNVIAATRRAGVRSVVFLGSQDADEDSPFCYAHTYATTERWLCEAFEDLVVVRAGLHAEFLGTWLVEAGTSGVLSLPMPTGVVAPIAQADVAASLVSALTASSAGARHVVTGAETYDHADLARLAARLGSRAVESQPVSSSEFAQRMLVSGESPWWRYAFETMFAAVEQGRFGYATDDLTTLTGRQATTFADVLAARKGPVAPD